VSMACRGSAPLGVCPSLNGLSWSLSKEAVQAGAREEESYDQCFSWRWAMVMKVVCMEAWAEVRDEGGLRWRARAVDQKRERVKCCQTYKGGGDMAVGFGTN